MSALTFTTSPLTPFTSVVTAPICCLVVSSSAFRRVSVSCSLAWSSWAFLLSSLWFIPARSARTLSEALRSVIFLACSACAAASFFSRSLMRPCAWTMKTTVPIKYTTATTIKILRTTGLPPSCGISDIVISSKNQGWAMAIIVEQNCCSVNEKPARTAMYSAGPPKPWQMQLLQHARLNSASNETMAVHPQIMAHVAKLRPLMNRRVMSLVLVVIGVVLLGYVTGQYWGMYRSQKNLEAEWQRQAATTSSTATAAGSLPGKAPDSVPVSPDRVLTRLEIPKIQ